MKCKSCSNTLPKNSNFCPNCGQKVSSVNTVDRMDVPDKQKKNSDFMLLAAVLIIGSIAVFYLLYPDTNTEQTANVQSGETSDLMASSEMHDQLDELLKDLQKNPDDRRLIVSVANLYYDVGKYDKALFYYNSAIQKNDKEPDIIIDAAVCYFNLGDYVKAQDFVERALKINPEHTIGLFNLGIILSARGQEEKAAGIWKKVLDIAPNSPQAGQIRQMLNSTN